MHYLVISNRKLEMLISIYIAYCSTHLTYAGENHRYVQ